jgi:hypothetical protein
MAARSNFCSPFEPVPPQPARAKTTHIVANTRAREAQADKLFKECLEIADKATPENVSVALAG